MRTTVKIDDQLLLEAKQKALASNTSLSALIETALKEMLSKRQHPGKRIPVKLVTFKGQGIKHGVDLDDTAALFDLMDAE